MPTHSYKQRYIKLVSEQVCKILNTDIPVPARVEDGQQIEYPEISATYSDESDTYSVHGYDGKLVFFGSDGKRKELNITTDMIKRLNFISASSGFIRTGTDPLISHLMIMRLRSKYKLNSLLRDRDIKQYYDGSPETSGPKTKAEIAEYILDSKCFPERNTFTADEILQGLHPNKWSLGRGSWIYSEMYKFILDAMVLDGDITEISPMSYQANPQIIRTVEDYRKEVRNENRSKKILAASKRVQYISLAVAICSAIATTMGVVVTYSQPKGESQASQNVPPQHK